MGMNTLLKANEGNIAWQGDFKQTIVGDLTALFSVDKNEATLHKLADKNYVENFLAVHQAAFPDTDESYHVLFSLSLLTGNNREKLKISEYFVNHTLSNKVKDLVVAVKQGNLEKTKSLSKEMLLRISH